MTARRLVAWSTVGLLLLWTGAPLALMLLTSLAAGGVSVAQQHGFTLESYRTVLTDPTQGFLASAGWSMMLATLVTSITLLLALPAAFALSRFQTRRTVRVLGGWIFSTRFLPPIVAAIPLFIAFRTVGLLNTPWPLISADLLLTLPFATWVLRTYIDDIPSTLDDLATVDALSGIRRLAHVLLPSIAAPLFAIAAMSWLLIWNEYLFGLLFSTDVRPITVTIAAWNTYLGIQWGPACAAGVLAALPAALLLWFCGRFAGRLFGFGWRV